MENNFLRITEKKKKKKERDVPAFFTLPPLKQFEAKNYGTLVHGRDSRGTAQAPGSSAERQLPGIPSLSYQVMVTLTFRGLSH